MIYLVCGTGRSGTSMMMHALAAGGMPILYDDRCNAEAISKELNGYKPWQGGLYELGDIPMDSAVEHADHAMKAPLHRVFLLPQRPLLWYKAIWMERDLDEVMTSVERSFGDTDWLEDVDKFRRALRMMCDDTLRSLKRRKDVVDVTIVDYNKLVLDPLPEFQRIWRRGWPIEPRLAARVVDPKLYRNRGTDGKPALEAQRPEAAEEK